MNKIKQSFKRKVFENLGEDKKSEVAHNVVSKLLTEIQNDKDRILLFCPDLDVVNPIAKVMYDLAVIIKKESKKPVFIVHEKDGFKCDWLISFDKEKYKGIKFQYLQKKAGSKTNRMKANFEFKLNDSLFIPDINIELLTDNANIKQFALIQKNLVVTGYNALYTLDPGRTLRQVGVNNCLYLNEQVQQDFESMFVNVKHFFIGNLFSKEQISEEQLRMPDEFKPLPYILISGAGNNDKINKFVNIFYNKYPAFNWVKVKIINRTNLSSFALDIKDALCFIDLDKHYISPFNQEYANILKTPYLSTNSLRENIGEENNNLITDGNETGLFELVKGVVEILYSLMMNNNSVIDEFYVKKIKSNYSEQNILNTLEQLTIDKTSAFNKLQEISA